jgi:hypothetical protein
VPSFYQWANLAFGYPPVSKTQIPLGEEIASRLDSIRDQTDKLFSGVVANGSFARFYVDFRFLERIAKLREFAFDSNDDTSICVAMSNIFRDVCEKGTAC